MDPKRVRKSRKKAAELAFRLAMLSEDVVEEILLRLPAKSVVRFRAVSKSWHGLLCDRVFLHAHQDHASRSVLLRKRTRVDNDIGWDKAIYTLPLGQRAATRLCLGEGLDQVVLHGCCDGLLLFSRRDPYTYEREHRLKYSVYNPTTREHVRLPGGRDYNLNVAGFYFHAPTAEYRVLFYRCYRTERVPPREGQAMTRNHYAYSVAAVGRPEVRRLAPTTYGGYTRWTLNDAPVFLLGCLHWMRKIQRVIVFDTVSEKFHGMRGPMEDRRMVGRLVAIDGTLGASSFAKGTLTVNQWVLQDYDKETWTLRYKVDVTFLGGDLEFDWLGITHVNEAGDALFYGARRYAVYNLRKRKVVSAGREIDARLTATWHVYRESLVSLAPRDVGADPAPTPNPLVGLQEPAVMEWL